MIIKFPRPFTHTHLVINGEAMADAVQDLCKALRPPKRRWGTDEPVIVVLLTANIIALAVVAVLLIRSNP